MNPALLQFTLCTLNSNNRSNDGSSVTKGNLGRKSFHRRVFPTSRFYNRNSIVNFNDYIIDMMRHLPVADPSLQFFPSCSQPGKHASKTFHCNASSNHHATLLKSPSRRELVFIGGSGLALHPVLHPALVTAAEDNSVYNLSASMYGEPYHLSKYANKVTVFVNVASE